MEKVILVVSVAGYDRHEVPRAIEHKFTKYEGGQEWRNESYGYHKYYYNSEGYQLLYITNHSLPEGTRPIDVWSEIWDMEQIEDIIQYREHTSEYWVPEPIEFEVNGQQYKYLGEVWGYDSDSTSPTDDRYQA